MLFSPRSYQCNDQGMGTQAVGENGAGGRVAGHSGDGFVAEKRPLLIVPVATPHAQGTRIQCKDEDSVVD
jgi:hypothetical protein